jgi:uncharacterized SAM-binding protein YcdF (DUF218 family)
MRRGLVVGLVFVALIALAALTPGVWLPVIARFLVVDESLDAADVIAVFAGGRGERAEHAARLFQRRLASTILVTGGEVSGEIALFCGQRITGADLSARRLRLAGIPDSAVVVIPKGTSTYEEAAVVRDYLKARGHRSVIAVSSAYHMRRVRATLQHQLEADRTVVRVSAADTPDFQPRHWWRNERGLLLVTHEYLKLAYYQLHLL